MFQLIEGRVAIVGILNVTPDSFSDGGRFDEPLKAVTHAKRMMEEGADIIDVGGESTRPGSQGVTVDEELRRVMPVIEELVREGIPLSIDTSKPEVARRAVQAGASLVNDVTGLRDPSMIEVVAESGAMVCIMHMQGTPNTMQARPTYNDVVTDIREYLYHAATLAEQAGVARDRIWVDPGIGFGKTTVDNIELLRRLDEIAKMGYPVMVGVSRKAWIGRILGSHEEPVPTEERLFGTLAAQCFAQLMGASILRVHDVGPARDAVTLLEALRFREA